MDDQYRDHVLRLDGCSPGAEPECDSCLVDCEPRGDRPYAPRSRLAIFLLQLPRSDDLLFKWCDDLRQQGASSSARRMDEVVVDSSRDFSTHRSDGRRGWLVPVAFRGCFRPALLDLRYRDRNLLHG